MRLEGVLGERQRLLRNVIIRLGEERVQRSRPGLVGVRFAPEGVLSRAYHSIYFQMLGDHGFVGLGIFLLLGLAGWVAARRVIRWTRDRPDFRWANELARMIQVSIVVFAVGGAFLSLAGSDLYYHLLVIASLLQVVVARELGIRESQPYVLAGGVVDSSAGRRASSPMPEQRPIRLE